MHGIFSCCVWSCCQGSGDHPRRISNPSPFHRPLHFCKPGSLLESHIDDISASGAAAWICMLPGLPTSPKIKDSQWGEIGDSLKRFTEKAPAGIKKQMENQVLLDRVVNANGHSIIVCNSQSLSLSVPAHFFCSELSNAMVLRPKVYFLQARAFLSLFLLSCRCTRHVACAQLLNGQAISC